MSQWLACQILNTVSRQKVDVFQIKYTVGAISTLLETRIIEFSNVGRGAINRCVSDVPPYLPSGWKAYPASLSQLPRSYE